MATNKINSMSLEKLLEMRTAVDAEITARSGGSGSATGAAKKAKKVKRVSQGSAWADYTKMIVKEKAAEFTAFKEASEVKQGVAPRFVATYRKAHEPEWEAFQAEWNAAHPKAEKGSAAASVAEENPSADEGASEKAPNGKRRGPKKLADMTPEQRAAHNAAVQKRREAKKAPADAEEQEAKAAAPVVAAPVVAAPVVAAPVVAAPVPKAVPKPAAVEEAEDEGMEERRFTLDGQKYIRLWDSGANDWATGDLWVVKANGDRDYYYGELMEDGSINTDAEAPELD